MPIQKIKSGRVITVTADEYVADVGIIFYNEDVGDLRLGDGITPGGIPIGGGEFTGDIYFLINGWRLYIDHSCFIDGVIYSDDYPSPFLEKEGTQIVINRVSALVQTIETGGGGTAPSAADIRQEMDQNSVKLNAINNQTDTLKSSLAALDTKIDALPTASETADAVWSHTLRELSTTLTPQQFWDFLLSTPMAPGSAGEKLKNVLTTGNFLALK